MLEKARIHRTMLQLDQVRAFTANDIAEETGAAVATVRKNLDRDLHAGWIAAEAQTRGVGVGRPEKLYRMTAPGRRQVAREVDRAYQVLAAVDVEPEDEPATLTAGRQTVSSLTDGSLDRSAFIRRLRMAQAEFSEAELVATGRMRGVAGRLNVAVRSALEAARAVPERNQAEWQATRDHILTQLGDQEAKVDSRFDQLVSTLRGWREAERPSLEDLLQQISRAVRIVFPQRFDHPAVNHGLGHFAEQPNLNLIEVNGSISTPGGEIKEGRFARPPAWQDMGKAIGFPPTFLS